MIQLNLLPDVKVKYIKAQRSKRMVLLSAIVVSGVSLGILAILVSVVYGAQKVQLSYYDKEIKKNTAELKKIDGLDKILTVQNQLLSIDGLHAEKPVTSRIFTFLPQITPSDVQIASLNLKHEDSTMQISGTAKSLEAVNKYVDTLKFTKYSTESSATPENAFSSVVLSSFSRTDNDAGFTVALKFDPAIFKGENKTVTLVVPKITSTRSQTETPSALFNQQTTGGQQ